MKHSTSATAILLSFALAASSALADDHTEAEKQFQAGVSLQQVEDFDAAILAFEASVRLYPTRSALFNLANCLRATHRYVEALTTLERLQGEFGDELEGEMRAAVERQLEELENLTARLVIEVDQAGAHVLVDGKLVGQTPLANPIRLSPGSHEVEVKLPGYATAHANVDLVPSQTGTARVELQRTPPPAPPSPAPPAPAPEGPVAPPDAAPNGLATAGWITTGAGVALLAGGAVTGILALSLDGELATDCTDGHCPTDRGADVDRLHTLATTTDVLLGTGFGALAAGLVMLLLDAPATHEAPPQTALSLSAGPRFVGATYGGRF